MNDDPIGTLPKVELHLHLEGTLAAETVLALAERNHVDLPYRDLADLSARYEFTDLNDFLVLCEVNVQVLRREADFYDLAADYVARAAEAGVRHAEVSFTPQAAKPCARLPQESRARCVPSTAAPWIWSR